MKQISYADFDQIEVLIGTIIKAEEARGTHTRALRLMIDFGERGLKKSSAQITERYTAEELPGMQVAAVVNFPPKQIGKFMSECLVLGALDKNGTSLLTVSKETENGSRVA
jgi:tRNA-binding protein